MTMLWLFPCKVCICAEVRLPLSQKDIVQIENLIQQEFDKAATDQMLFDSVRQQFFNLARYSFEQLT